MSRNLMIPPNFVTLRHLKELKEKREEEERLLKLKEEEEERERLRKLDEEDRLRKLKEEEEEEESLKNPPPKALESKGPYRRKWKKRGSKQGANSRTRPSRGGRPDGGTNLEAPAPADGRSGRRPSANPVEVSNSGANLEAAANGKSELEEKFRRKNRRSKNRDRKMTKMPLGLNVSEEGVKGLGAPTNEIEEKTIKVVADTKGLGAPASEKKLSKEVSGSERKKTSGGVSYRSVKVIGTESRPIAADIEKRVSDLKKGQRNQIRSWGGRTYRAGPSGRGGGGSGGVMMWVKKTSTEA